jgi:hypothetical protein
MRHVARIVPLGVLLPILPFVALLLTAWHVISQELPHAEFARGLRAKQYPDLALDYLLKIKKDGGGDKDPTLLLELASTRLELADQESEINRRLVLLGQARAELDEFLAKHANHPQAPAAELQQARLAALQGKTQLSKALRSDTQGGEMDAVQARMMLEEADKRFDQVRGKIDAQLKKLGEDPKSDEEIAAKKALTEARLQVDFDKGLNLFDQAQTYFDSGGTDDLERRAAKVREAIKTLERITATASNDSKLPLAWQAGAWVGRCYNELGDPSKALSKLQGVADSRVKEAEIGQRSAKYFLLLVPRQSTGPKDDVRENRIASATQWLKDYPRARVTPEGFGVRYEMALAHVELGLDPKLKGQQKQHFDRARALCKELERSENDFVDKARQLQMTIVKAEGGFTRDIKTLNSFEDCLIRARYEASLLAKEKDNEGRKKGFQKIISILERGLDLNSKASTKAPASEINQALAMLSGYYLFSEAFDKVIQTGEPVARSKPATAQTGTVAMYVLEALGEKVLKHLQNNDPPEEWASEKKQFSELAQYVEQTWPNESPANFARHQMGRALLIEKKYPQAVEVLARVTPDYSGIHFVKFMLADAALRVEGDQKQAFADKARAALESMPELPNGAAAASSEVYLQGKHRLGLMLLNQKKYDDVDRLVDSVLVRLPTLRLDNEQRKQVHQGNLSLLKHYTASARAGTEYSAGHFSKVREMLDPVVESVKNDRAPELKQDPRLARNLLTLALSANVQDNQFERAQQILQALRKAIPDDDKEEGNAIILRQVAQLVQELVRSAKGKNSPEETEKAINGFALFVDKLSEEYAKDTNPETRRLLAACYASLEKHEKAVDLLRNIEEPKGTNGAATDPKAEQNYRAARILLVRELRQANNLTEAEKLLKEIQTTPWGKTNLDVVKESYHLLEAQGKYTQAAARWSDLVNRQLIPKINLDPQMKVQYFECYYYLTNCLYHAGAKGKDEKAIKRSADLIARLEQKWPDFGGDVAKARFDQLLASDQNLKNQYEVAKKKLEDESKKPNK